MIKEDDFKAAAITLNCEVAVIKAVDFVESRSAGFNRNGSLKILFEGHVFWRELEKNGLDPSLFVQGNENVLYKKWTKAHYSKGKGNEARQKGEWLRLQKAIAIGTTLPNEVSAIIKECALLACSFGRYQIMGFNYKNCGFADVFDFFFMLNAGEEYHLQAFLKFVESANLIKHLRTQNWAAFAKGYNGKMYAKNKYDIKLANAYLKFKII